jgi:formate hydrogenlyase subunit 6/NADH:ubiquinone oxidoreductase subunit I
MEVITHDNLLIILKSIVDSGKELYAPQRKAGKTFFLSVKDVASIVFDYVQTTESPKELLFPKVERMLSYKFTDGKIQVTDYSQGQEGPNRVLFGSRPCDAIGMKTLAEFFRQDMPDAFFQQRQDALTIISMSCVRSDENCFCTSVGAGPGDSTGSDILLTPIEDSRYLVECPTEKGKTLVESYKELFEQTGAADKEKYLTKIQQTFSHVGIARMLSKAFDNPVWNEASLRCIGCGACAYVCPVCSCFDIQDEGNNKKGDRLRCWDSCAFALFTLHTSGHNPRPTQSTRWRQRVTHKFAYMPERYDLVGCVGCGRCSRSCPADMNLKEELAELGHSLEEVSQRIEEHP